eukprot:TRINITY_DN13942_c0_g1_i2.p2 TRINITY_DN13942_c0_g1~~TRINITY_DN13942_c0_g1_i2.p2  ORF type:complete len:121 (+),score=8.65 TRINITY_DN13942_c0_g1_i2:256-618(+)
MMKKIAQDERGDTVMVSSQQATEGGKFMKSIEPYVTRMLKTMRDRYTEDEPKLLGSGAFGYSDPKSGQHQKFSFQRRRPIPSSFAMPNDIMVEISVQHDLALEICTHSEQIMGLKLKLHI